jgi:hypothetical protein
MTKKRRSPLKFTASGKITLTAVSLIGFIGGWNMIARLENHPAQAAPVNVTPQPVITPAARATIWPTIAPLPELSPAPTLALNLSGEIGGLAVNVDQGVKLTPVELVPLPTLAPLPELPQAPPPAPVAPAGNWGQSGGS